MIVYFDLQMICTELTEAHKDELYFKIIGTSFQSYSSTALFTFINCHAASKFQLPLDSTCFQ